MLSKRIVFPDDSAAVADLDRFPAIFSSKQVAVIIYHEMECSWCTTLRVIKMMACAFANKRLLSTNAISMFQTKKHSCTEVTMAAKNKTARLDQIIVEA
jgi:hypothetical protein